MSEHLKSLLPADWDEWSLDRKARYMNELRYNWRMWARPNQLPPEGDWDLWLLLAGRGFGKLADVELPILRLPATESGHGEPEWATFGDVRLGDKVFAPNGVPTLVIGAYDPEEQDEYLVQFSDGSEVSVGPDHEWITWTHRDRKQIMRYDGAVPDEWWSFTGDLLDSHHNVTGQFGPEVRTTEDILANLKIGGDTNHSIPLAKPLQHNTATLPVDPYVLGVWLGDGSSTDGTVAQHPDDAAWLRQHLESLGVRTTLGLRTGLHSIGVLGNKRIPDAYLFADVEQRLAVVQGLMDTGGSVSPTGHVEFCNTSPLIVDGMLKLLWSLGQKPVTRWSAGFQTHPDGTRTRHKDRFRVTFTPTMQVFRLPRKSGLVNTDTGRPQGGRNTHRMITNVVKTGRKIPMRCIKVAHESSLFLIGHEMIPTHNTRTGAEFIKERMLAEPMSRVGIVGQTIGATRDVCLEGEALALDTPILTSNGWSTMSDLQVDDQVLAGDGSFTRVQWVSDVYHGRPTYEIEFAGGDTIVADENHKWVVSTYQSRVERVKTTAELLEKTTLRGRVYQWRVAAPVATEGATRDHVIDPYVLGYWLGDGTTKSAAITTADQFVVEEFNRLGYPTTPHGKALYAFGVRNLQERLRSENQIRNKHIPSDAWTWTPEDRLSLIQGLMDSDGDISERGQAAFNNTNYALISDLRDLLLSVGVRVSRPRVQSEPYEFTATNGKNYTSSRIYRISFTPTTTVFRLPRKASRVLTTRTETDRRSIVGIKQVDSVPVRCISVEHPSETFLAGRSLTVTHNSGLLSVLDPALVLKYNRSLGQLRLKNGSYAQTFSGGDPDKLRGFQSHYLWMDELCAMQYAQTTYDMAIMGLRLGRNPKMIVTTTPKPTPLIIDMVNRSRQEPDRVKITTGSTFDNAANLADSTLASLRARYEGTTMGRQELYAELILEEPGALWNRPQIEKNRLAPGTSPCRKEDMAEIVVGVDPNMSQTTERKTECGIVVVGRGVDGHGYVLEDASMERPSPDAWATVVVQMYHKWSANHVVAEVNQGYDLVMHTIHTVDPKVPVKKVYSVRGKSLRAEPIAALTEQDRIHHAGYFQELEDQMVQWVPGNASPDRLDACLAPGTLILMGDGETEVPIEDVSPGDLVLTRDGPREVLFSGMTGVRPLMHLETNHQELFLTEDHPVWVGGIGWVQGHSVQVDARLHTWNTTTKMIGSTRPRLCTTADATRGLSARLGGINVSTTSLPDGRMARRFTDRSFWIGTGSSLTDSLSTTPTTTWSPSSTQSTSSTTTAWSSTWRASGTWQPSDIARMRGGTAAVAGSRPSVSATVVGSFAASRVVASVSAVSVVSPVYNLTVAGTHEFIANGILTHNCVHGFTKVLLGGGIAEFFSPSNLPRLPSLIR